MTQEEWSDLEVESHRLSALMKDQHPGLLTWVTALDRTMRKLHDLTGSWLDEQGIDTEAIRKATREKQ